MTLWWGFDFWIFSAGRGGQFHFILYIFYCLFGGLTVSCLKLKIKSAPAKIGWGGNPDKVNQAIDIGILVQTTFFFNKRLVIFVCVALPGAFFSNMRLVVFVCVALRAASILKNRVFLCLINVIEVAKHLYLGGFEHRECLRTLSFEKCCRMH